MNIKLQKLFLKENVQTEYNKRNKDFFFQP